MNEIIPVDYSCLLVSRTNRTNHARWIGGGEQHQAKLMPAFYSDSGIDKDWRSSDLRRAGLMGPHVSVIIFEGNGHKYGGIHDIVRSIALHCTQVRRIVIQNVSQDSYHGWRSRTNWCAGYKNISAGLPCLQSLTFINLKLFFYGASPCMAQPMAIPLLKIDWNDNNNHNVADQDGQGSLDAFIWPYPECQREWVARNAPKLPEMYHRLAAAGLPMARLVFH